MSIANGLAKPMTCMKNLSKTDDLHRGDCRWQPGYGANLTLEARRWLWALALCLAAWPALGQSRPLGFSLQVSTDGIFSPKVVKAVVGKVEEASQAKAAGLSAGDELIGVDGIEVPGNSAHTLKPHMEFAPGKPKRLTFRRPDGTRYDVTLTKEPQ